MGYLWGVTPEGGKICRWACGKTREETHKKWLKLHEPTSKGPVPTKHPTVAAYLTRRLAEVVKPKRELTTYVAYEPLVRLSIIPGMGKKRLDKLAVRGAQILINMLATLCTCCNQQKDHQRPEARRRRRSEGECGKNHPSRSTVASIRRTCAPRSALPSARN
ncbi:hypothetical protein AB0B56_17360 [Streptosporangium canum]|uniref:hypothetical protein n=1 Tax=Streptosporangium canum TaxID=324952 RepID=UPI00342F7696